MNIDERIRRRDRTNGTTTFKPEPLDPTRHLLNPVRRSLVLERILDTLDPVFEEQLPPNFRVWGPPGSGKSAVVFSLFRWLDHYFHLRSANGAIPTTTRTRTHARFDFVYIDARSDGTRFQLCQSLLDELVDESIPERGVSLDAISDRLREVFASTERNAVVAIDHVGEHGSPGPDDVEESFEEFAESLSWVTIGRDDTEERSIRLDPYDPDELVEILVERFSESMSHSTLEHRHARTIAEWAAGDAERALTALLGAVLRANETNAPHLSDDLISEGIGMVPDESVSLGRILALPENKLRILDEYIDIDHNGYTIKRSSEIISQSLDLSPATIERMLYELCDQRVFTRLTPKDRGSLKGRPASYILPLFAMTPYRFLRRFDSPLESDRLGEDDVRAHDW